MMHHFLDSLTNVGLAATRQPPPSTYDSRFFFVPVGAGEKKAHVHRKSVVILISLFVC